MSLLTLRPIVFLLFIQLILVLRTEALIIKVRINTGAALIIIGSILVDFTHDDNRSSAEN